MWLVLMKLPISDYFTCPLFYAHQPLHLISTNRIGIAIDPYLRIMVEKPPPGHFRILYFAAAASFTKKSFDDFPAPFPVKDVFQLLDSKYPGIRQTVLSSSAVTVNLDYVDVEESLHEGGSANHSEPTVIQDGDEVAIIPPVSSG